MIREYFFNFEIKKLNITIDIFQTIIIKQDMFGYVPSITLVLKVTELEFIKEVKPFTEANVKIGLDEGNFEDIDLLIVDYSIKKERDYYFVTINGILDIKDFLYKKEQKYYDGNFTDIIREFSIDVITNVNSNDKQIWLRPNISEKTFFDNNILHIKTNKKYLVYGINFQKKLLLKEYDLNEGTKQEISLGEIHKNIIEHYEFKTKNLLSNIYADGKELIEINPYLQKINFYNDVSELKEPSNIDYSSFNYNCFIDCGNTHEDFFKCYIENIYKIVNIQRVNLDVSFRGIVLDKDLTITDLVKIKIFDNQTFNKYFILKSKEVIVESDKVYTNLTFITDKIYEGTNI